MPRTKRTTGQQHPLLKNLCNQYFGKLHIIGLAGTTKDQKAQWLCKCECGKWIITTGDSLRNKGTKSCGCLRGPLVPHTTHKDSGSPEYHIFLAAKYRCTVATHQNYANYGGRGIEFRFESYPQFIEHLGRRPSAKHSLERVNNDGHYEIGNVKWATAKEQTNNRRTTVYLTAFGRTQPITSWCEEFSIDRCTIRDRLKSGWCTECAMSTRPHSGKCLHR